MKTNKTNPLAFFRKSYEDREKRIKSSLKKFAKGGPGDPPAYPASSTNTTNPPATSTTTPAPPAPAAEKTEEQKAAEAKSEAQAKAASLGAMSNKEYHKVKKGIKRAKKLERIESGAQGERVDNVIKAIGSGAEAASGVIQTINQGKEIFNKKRGGMIAKKKMAPGGTVAPGKYTSDRTNLLGRNVKKTYDVPSGTITKTVTKKNGELVRDPKTRTMNSSKVARKANTRKYIDQQDNDPSESSGSFARKGTIVKKKMAMGGTATNKKSPVSDTGMRKRFSSPIGQAKRGGATKAAKFAALAPPYNKATAADRIAGAKKKAKKK
jgi:hypothetical protein